MDLRSIVSAPLDDSAAFAFPASMAPRSAPSHLPGSPPSSLFKQDGTSPTGSVAGSASPHSPALDDDELAPPKPGFSRRSVSSPTVLGSRHACDAVSKPHAAPSRKCAHILSEQRRRENINDGFMELKSSIPHCRGSQDSKAVVLRKAVQYISSLESRVAHLEQALQASRTSPAALAFGKSPAYADPYPRPSGPGLRYYSHLPPPPTPPHHHQAYAEPTNGHGPARYYVSLNPHISEWYVPGAA